MTVVLAPIDGSARALVAVPWAAKLAGPEGTVVLFRAIPPEPAYAGALLTLAGGGNSGVQHIRDEWARVAQADLDEAARLVDTSGTSVEQLIAEGEPDEAILAAVEKSGAEMIAMASHGRGAIGRAIFGSVADRVARTSPVPVMILRAADETKAPAVSRVQRVIVPLDGSKLAEEALPVAIEVARHLNAPIHVVRAVEPASNLPVSPGTLGVAPSLTPEILDRVWQEAEAEARRTIKEAIVTLQAQGVEASGATLNGSPFFAITEITEPDDLLILTSHGRGGVRRWLLGSVAEKLVREAPAPVILVPATRRVEQTASGGAESGR